MEAKIYQFEIDGEKVWVAANNEEEAVKEYQDLDDDREYTLTELPKEEWSKQKVRNGDYDETDPEDWEVKTFEEFMIDCVGTLKGYGMLIAGTEFD